MRQPPIPHGTREHAMTLTKAWLVTHPYGATYPDLAHAVGMSVQRTARAVDDLRWFDPDLIVSVPAPLNGYKARAKWNDTTRKGEGNQARHAATRLRSMARRWEKIANDREHAGDLPLAMMLRN